MISCKFVCHELKFTVTPKLSGGVTVIHHAPEGWNQIQRMWRRSAVEWQGAQGMELQIPWIFDQWGFNKQTGHPRNSVEKEILRLETLAEYDFGKFRTPIFTIDAGGAVPWDIHNAPNKRWVCSELDMDDDYILNRQKDRCRQSGIIYCIEFLQESLVKSKVLVPTKRIPSSYRIKRGDTLVKIATYFYGDGSRWRTIAKLNHIKDPVHLRAGRTIKLPTR